MEKTTIQDVLDAGGEIFGLPIIDKDGCKGIVACSDTGNTLGFVRYYEDGKYYRNGYINYDMEVYADGIRVLDEIDPDDPKRLYRVTGHHSSRLNLQWVVDYEPLIPENKTKSDVQDEADWAINIAFGQLSVDNHGWFMRYLSACQDQSVNRVIALTQQTPNNKLAALLGSYVKWLYNAYDIGRGWSLMLNASTCPCCALVGYKPTHSDSACDACPLTCLEDDSPYRKAEANLDKQPLLAEIKAAIEKELTTMKSRKFKCSDWHEDFYGKAKADTTDKLALKFKKGDRVRCTQSSINNSFIKNKTYTVLDCIQDVERPIVQVQAYNEYGRLDNFDADFFELVDEETEIRTLAKKLVEMAQELCGLTRPEEFND